MFEKIIKRLAQKYNIEIYEKAFKLGHDIGYNEGYDEAQLKLDETCQIGYTKGYEAGYDAGYDIAKAFYTKGCFKKGNTYYKNRKDIKC